MFLEEWDQITPEAGTVVNLVFILVVICRGVSEMEVEWVLLTWNAEALSLSLCFHEKLRFRARFDVHQVEVFVRIYTFEDYER